MTSLRLFICAKAYEHEEQKDYVRSGRRNSESVANYDMKNKGKCEKYSTDRKIKKSCGLFHVWFMTVIKNLTHCC